jgi:CTP synthase (UTP-ammonia lyase)
VITPLWCSLVGQQQAVHFEPGSRPAALYGRAEVLQPFYCNYGLSPEWESRLATAGLRVTARGEDGEARVLELDAHPFFLGTLFLPQLRSESGSPDPIVQAFVDASWRS